MYSIMMDANIIAEALPNRMKYSVESSKHSTSATMNVIDVRMTAGIGNIMIHCAAD